MTTDDGRKLVFDLSMSGGTDPDLLSGLEQAGLDVAGVAAAFQQELSKWATRPVGSVLSRPPPR